MMHDHRCSIGLQGNLFPLGIDVRLGHVDPEQRVNRAIWDTILPLLPFFDHKDGNLLEIAKWFEYLNNELQKRDQSAS
jgi:hypothetical protein